MKKLLLFTTLFFNIITFAQFQYAYGPYMPGASITGLAIKDNYLYFGSYSDNNNIYKINLAGPPNQSPIIVVTNISGVMDLQFNGNDLYISQFNGGKIKKVDVSLSSPVLIDVVNGVNAPAGMVIYNNYLYFGEAYGYKISRINLNLSNPIVEEVVPYANSPWKIQLYGNELYVAETYGNKISKLNLLDSNPVLTDVITNITSPYCIYIKDNFLYFANGQNNLSRLDLSSSNQIPVDLNLLFGSSDSSRWIINNDNYLYRSGTMGTIQKYNLNTLSLNNIDREKTVEIFPNPTSSFITIKNLEKEENIKIINSLGQIIKTEKINIDGVLNIEDLENGIYYIKIENFSTYKLLKK